MTLGAHRSSLHKAKKLSQGELGKKVGTSGDIIGRYERGEVTPSIDVAAKIADALEVSLDFLIGKVDQELDQYLLKRMIEVQQMGE